MGDKFYLFLSETSLPFISPSTPWFRPQKSKRKNKKEGRKEKSLVGAKGELAVIANVSISPCFFPPASLAYR